MANVVSVAAKNQIDQIIICFAWGVGNSRQNIPILFRWTIDFSNIRYVYKDHGRQEAILRKSGLNFTIVRPVGLINSKKPQPIKESVRNSPTPNLLITRKMVASYMVDCISNDTKENQTITISKE